MICRLWHGWTTASNAPGYDNYLKNDLFPRVERELTKHGYCGHQILRLNRGSEVEFVTLLWFESIESVKSFAGVEYEVPDITERAKALLSGYDERCVHYEVSGYHFSAPR